jgi:hypothetical protein
VTVLMRVAVQALQFIDVALVATGIVAVLAVLVVVLEVRSRMRRFDGRLFEVSAPATNGAPEQFFMSLHGLLRSPLRRLIDGQPCVSLEFVGSARQVRCRIWIGQRDESLVKGLLRAAYPGVEFHAAAEPRPDCAATALAEARLARGDLVPIQTAFAKDSLSGLFSVLASADADELAIQLLVRPKSSRWRKAASQYAQGLRDGRRGSGRLARSRRTQAERDLAKAIEEKGRSPGFDCVLRVVVTGGRRDGASDKLRATAANLVSFAEANQFALRRVVLARRRFADLYRRRQFPIYGSFVLTARELAGLWHLPREDCAHLVVVRSPKLAPPPGASAGERQLGFSAWDEERIPVGLSVADSRHHLHLLGSSGTGKTTAMLNLAAQDIAAGRGVGVLDPKGDLVRGLLARIPRARLDDVVLISPEETDWSVGINPLELWPGDDRDLVADNVLTIFKRIYERYWGPRTDDVLKSAILTLLRRPDSTLAHVPLLLTNAAFRERTLEGVRDPLGLDGFWAWFNKLSETKRTEAIGPVLNKLRDFLVRPRLRRLLCQQRSTMDLRRVVDSGQILLADLSVGRWGDTTSALIGSFLVARLWQAVLARSATDEDQRRDFFLFVDEFQHFPGIAGPFADVLAEARSLRLSLTIANQHLGQLTPDLREAVASNARSRVVFQCGQDDAAYLAREFAPLDATALMSLDRFEAAARLSIAGRSSRPLILRTVPSATAAESDLSTEARAASRQRYARSVEIIDRELEAILPPTEGSAASEKRRPGEATGATGAPLTAGRKVPG